MKAKTPAATSDLKKKIYVQPGDTFRGEKLEWKLRALRHFVEM